MIAFAKTPNRKRVAPVRHGAFLKMLPAIRHAGRICISICAG